MKDKEIGIYIHIPFCEQKCYYCDFVSYSNKCAQIERYIKAIEKEIDLYDLTNYDVTTIYIGGGTPSFIESKNIISILNFLQEKLKENSTIWKNIEITIEVNPGTVEKQKLRDYKNAGVNRLSIGLQTTSDKLLKQIGRIHTFEEFIETYKLAGELGFNNINVDLMLGLPNQTIEELKQSLKEVISLEPSHISVYSLIVESGTKLAKMIEEGKLQLPDEEIERQMYWCTKNILELNGYKHYEISNFCKKGRESKHNLNCWEQKEYIGIGTAAHSYMKDKRYSNTENLEQYIKEIETNIPKEESIIIQEKQSLKEKQKEYMMLGLRKIQGISIAKFKEKFIQDPIIIFYKELEKLKKEKLIKIEGDKISLTKKGLDFANMVWEEFV